MTGRPHSLSAPPKNGTGSDKEADEQSVSSGSDSDEEDEEDSGEDERGAPSKAPRQQDTKANGNGTAKAAAAGAAGGGILGGILGSSKRTESPEKDAKASDNSSIEEEADPSEDDDSESEEEDDDEYGDHRAALNDGVEEDRAQGKSKRKTSRAAQIAIDKMNEEVNLRNKKGKPLANLTAQDVVLTDEDLQEDISVNLTRRSFAYTCHTDDSTCRSFGRQCTSSCQAG